MSTLRKLAMELDGEYRTAFLKTEHPELKYGTAPAPVDDAQAGLYGGGYVTAASCAESPGTIAAPAYSTTDPSWVTVGVATS